MYKLLFGEEHVELDIVKILKVPQRLRMRKLSLVGLYMLVELAKAIRVVSMS